MLKIAMKLPLSLIFGALALNANASEQIITCQNLSQILELEDFSSFSQDMHDDFKNNAIWSENKTLIAFCDESSCFVVKPCETDPKVIDVSRVIKANLGYFGVNPIYQKIENTPLLLTKYENEAIGFWLGRTRDENSTRYDDPKQIGVVIRTRIWNKGQRYTKIEPVILINDVYVGR